MRSITQPGSSSELIDVYLLHFERPISDRHTCQHYLGSAIDLNFRLHKHRSAPDARLLQVAKERGISFTLARVWANVPRGFEYKLKSRKQSPKLCPLCSPHSAQLDLFFDFTLADVPELAF